MNLADPETLRSFLRRHGYRPQKRWGQHFLVSEQVVRAILQRVDGFLGVLEVGPGPGVLTAGMAERCERVVALEVDPLAVSALGESAPTVDVRRIDALQADIGSILDELPRPRALVSNMPYNITGPLLSAFAQARASFDRAVLMMQREVGDRVLALAGDSDRGSLSVFLQAQFEIHRICLVPPGAFWPPPKVSSVVLEFTPCRDVPIGASFDRLVRLGFAQPRKTLANNLAAGLARPRQSIETGLESIGLASSVRPHQLTLEDWRRLTQVLQDRIDEDPQGRSEGPGL